MLQASCKTAHRHLYTRAFRYSLHVHTQPPQHITQGIENKAMICGFANNKRSKILSITLKLVSIKCTFYYGTQEFAYEKTYKNNQYHLYLQQIGECEQVKLK